MMIVFWGFIQSSDSGSSSSGRGIFAFRFCEKKPIWNDESNVLYCIVLYCIVLYCIVLRIEV